MAVLAGAGIGSLDKGYSGSTSGVGRDFFEVVNTAIEGVADKINIQILAGDSALLNIKQWRVNGSNYDFINSSTLASALSVGLNSNIALTTSLNLQLGDIISIHIAATNPVTNVSVQNATNGTIKWTGSSTDVTTNIAASSLSSNLDGAFNFELTGTASASGSITPTDIKVATQRNLSTDSIAITGAGTYAGSPVNVERRVEYADGANETVLDWATYITSPTGNAFSDIISITITNARPLRVVYRFSNDLGITANTNAFYGGDYVLIAGESLAQDMGTDGTGTPTDNTFKVNLSTGALETNAGSGNISLANTLTATTGFALFVMNVGVSGLVMLQANEKQVGLYLYDPTTPTTHYNALLNAYNLAGDIAFLSFIIGVNDADVGIASSVDYQQSFADFFAKLRLDTRPDLTVIANTTGVFTNATDDADWSDYVFAQIAAYNSDANVYYTSSYDQPRKDYTHLNPAGYAELGVRLANGAITEVMSGSAPYKPMQITSVSVVSATETRVNVLIPSGTDFTPATLITELALSDDSGSTFAVSISSVAKGASDHITITHPSTTITNYRYNWGANPDVTGLVIDNSARSLPLLQSAGTVGGQSLLNLIATSYPDGTYSVEFYKATSPLIHIKTENVTFTNGASSATIPMAVSTTVYTRIDGDTPPSTGVTCYGVTV